MNGWRRLWVVGSVITFVLLTVVVVDNWPRPSREVLRDIHSPDCRLWLEVPKGFFPETVDPDCAALTALLQYREVNIGGLDDYEAYLSNRKVELVARAFVVWVALVVGVYGLGWSVAWIVAGFRSRPSVAANGGVRAQPSSESCEKR